MMKKSIANAERSNATKPGPRPPSAALSAIAMQNANSENGAAWVRAKISSIHVANATPRQTNT